MSPLTTKHRVLICGDRRWVNSRRVLEQLSKLHSEYPVELVIEGEALGADTCGRLAALELRIPVARYPADWRTHGKAAGPIRNLQMLKEGRPTLVMAFHEDISQSKGTKHMINAARKANISVWLFTSNTVTYYPSEVQGGLFGS